MLALVELPGLQELEALVQAVQVQAVQVLVPQRQVLPQQVFRLVLRGRRPQAL